MKPGHAAQGRETNPELSLMTLAPTVTPGEAVEASKFTGEAGEYFRIWIVSTFLTIITIGLWSPWAKIRKRLFFCGIPGLQEPTLSITPRRGRFCADA